MADTRLCTDAGPRRHVTEGAGTSDPLGRTQEGAQCRWLPYADGARFRKDARGVLASGVARFAKHDHSTSVLIALGESALAVLAGLLFLAGEVFIGHDERQAG